MATARPTHIKNIITCAVEKAQKQQQAINSLKRAWRLAVGEKAAKHSCPQRLTQKTLIVTVDSPVWIYYLHNNRQAIEHNINKQLAAPRNIKMRLRAGEGSGHNKQAST